MYVSYAVIIAVAVAIYVLTRLLGLDFGPLQLFATIVTGLVLSMPYTGAVSKSIWADFFQI
ncbi:hypothetical protein ACEZ3G_13170 [Maribacter algicola]|uniref:Uncharacterized protein n=1 Tax=Meishania litoralis TaxID=3434685 RepID=A0ACC7LS99_9FLAO